MLGHPVLQARSSAAPQLKPGEGHATPETCIFCLLVKVEKTGKIALILEGAAEPYAIRVTGVCQTKLET